MYMVIANGNETPGTPRTFGNGYLFGVPMGDLGWFTSVLMGAAVGFAGFFAATFCGIMGILIYNSATHHAVDFADSYKFIGLPVGIAVMVLSLTYFGTLWVKRITRKG
jgi:hypothetical protein